jgi:predicted DNA-binding transcriptional regulator AlpA
MAKYNKAPGALIPDITHSSQNSTGEYPFLSQPHPASTLVAQSVNRQTLASPRPFERTIGIDFTNPDAWVRNHQVCAHFGISSVTTWRWERDGKLPPSQYINGQKVWRVREIQQAEEAMLSSEEGM